MPQASTASWNIEKTSAKLTTGLRFFYGIQSLGTYVFCALVLFEVCN